MNDEGWAEFLDRLVHDIREPLRSVTAFSELLTSMAKSHLGEEGDQILNEIISGASRIAKLTDGVSSYSLALRTPASSDKASLQLAFNIAVMSLDKQIQCCGGTVMGADLPTVGVSLERLIQLLENVIGNALRFRSEALPVIHVSASEHPEGGWDVRVQDNGIGIASEHCEAIFKPFTRLNGRNYPGVGLSLATCRRIVEGYGGTIRMEPGPEGGAVCIFTLPAA